MGQFNKAQLAALLAGVVVLTGSETATLTAQGESVLIAIAKEFYLSNKESFQEIFK